MLRYFLRACMFVASAILFAHGLHAEGMAMAATGTYSPTTSSVDEVLLWRKVQGDLMVGIQFMAEEYEALDGFTNFKIDWSAREITAPIDVHVGAGVASIPEGGYEAMPSSPTVEEVTFSWVLLNKRFTATLTAMYIDQKNRAAEIVRQLQWQGKKAIESIGWYVADQFYGSSTGVLAQVKTTNASATTIDLENAFGDTAITDTTYLARLFRKGDRVAIVSGGTLTGIRTITAEPDTSAGTITVDTAIAVVAGDDIVKANSQENTSLTGGTDYNRGATGLEDVCFSDTVENLSKSTVPEWAPALTDTTAVRFTHVHLATAKQDIHDHGGGTITDIYMAPGVKRDILDNKIGQVRFADPLGLVMDGDIKPGSGMKLTSTRRVPPGFVIAFDKKSYRRMTLLRRPRDGDQPQWPDGQKIPDRSARVYSIDFPYNYVVLNRGNFAVFTGKTEQ